MNVYTDYRYVLDYYSLDYIEYRALYWRRMAEITIEQMGLKDKTFIDTRKMSNMICNYFADIIRLKEFHPIERTNTIKVFAYSTFWFLRTSPIQLTGVVSDEQLFINEKTAVNVLISEFFLEIDTSEDEEAHVNLAKEFLYFFKYRVYTSQTIEMIISSYLVGAKKTMLLQKTDTGQPQESST